MVAVSPASVVRCSPLEPSGYYSIQSINSELFVIVLSVTCRCKTSPENTPTANSLHLIPLYSAAVASPLAIVITSLPRLNAVFVTIRVLLEIRPGSLSRNNSTTPKEKVSNSTPKQITSLVSRQRHALV